MSEDYELEDSLKIAIKSLLNLRDIVQIVFPPGFGRTMIAKRFEETETGNVVYVQDFAKIPNFRRENTYLIIGDNITPNLLKQIEGMKCVIFSNKELKLDVPYFMITCNPIHKYTKGVKK